MPATLAAAAASLLLAGCSGISLPTFGTSSEAPSPMEAPAAALPSKYAPEEVIGRWGLAPIIATRIGHAPRRKPAASAAITTSSRAARAAVS
jgi:hypothetical protein